MSFPLALAVWAAAAGAWAAPRVLVAPFTGKKAAPVREQVVAEACKELDCVPLKAVLTGPRVDAKKAKKQRVQAIVSGTVNAVGKKAALYLVVQTPDKVELAPKKRFPLKNFKLDKRELAAAVEAIVQAAGGAAEPADEAPGPVGKQRGKETEPEDAAEEDAVAKTPSQPPQAPSEPERTEVARDNPPPIRGGTPPEDPQAVVEPKPRAGPAFKGVDDLSLRPGTSSQTFLTLEAGTDLFSRRFDYTQLTTANLRRYNAALVIAPTLAVQVFPLAGMKNLASGLGFEGAFALSVGLSSRESKDAPGHPTSLSRLDAGLKFKVRPISVSELSVNATAGFRRTSFSVGAAEDGTLLDGMPSVAYSALRFGVGAEVPLSAFSPFLRLSFLPVLSSGEISSAPYFPGGSAFGFELAIGTGITLAKHWELRLTGQLTRYGLAFQNDPASTYVASGAIDLYVGGTVTVRYVF